MAFKPERFLNSSGGEASDITGSREILVWEGARMCPGYYDEKKSTGPNNFEGRRD
jgi:hypothetical protein